MAWVQTSKIIGGYLQGKGFVSPGDLLDGRWGNAPLQYGDPGYCETGSGNVETFGGLIIPVIGSASGDQRAAILEIKNADPGANKQELIMYTNVTEINSDYYRVVLSKLYIRQYNSDASSYTESPVFPLNALTTYFYPAGSAASVTYGKVTEAMHLVFGIGSYNAQSVMLYGLVAKNTIINSGEIQCDGTFWDASQTVFYQTINGTIPTELEDPDLGPSSEPGGYGPGGGGAGGPAPTFDGTSDPWVDYPSKPGIAALGLVNLYKCDAGSLVNLGAELFPDIHFPSSLTDVGPVLAAISDSIWNSKLIDYIISSHIIPVDVTGGNLTDIKVGTRTMTGILARPITDDIIEFDCGSLHIDEFYTNYIDYKGTRCRIYLPFYGMVDIKAEYWQSATLQVKYLFNVIDGSFIAQIFSTVNRHQAPFKSMIGQYTGCACVHVPMTGNSYASMFGGMISGAGGMTAGFATGNAALAATSAINTMANTGGSGDMQMSNAYNASAGFYGHPCPYLIIERQVSHFSTRYAQEKGLPLLVAKTIGSCRGFTTAEDAILDGIPCTLEEKKRIRDYLKTGVILKNLS